MNIIEITTKQAFTMLEQFPDARLVDVRTPEEWQELPCASLKNPHQLLKISLGENFSEELCQILPNQHTQVLFICARGIRSKTAALMMMKLGYINSYNVIGGIYDWHVQKLLTN